MPASATKKCPPSASSRYASAGSACPTTKSVAIAWRKGSADAAPVPRPAAQVESPAPLRIKSRPLVITNKLEVAVERESMEYDRSEEHTSELQSREKLVCRLML